MTEPNMTPPRSTDEPASADRYEWTSGQPTDPADAGTPDPAGTSDARSRAGSSIGTDILGSLRDAVDDLVERAGPTVREISAKAAELAASAADRAAPIARRAGEATADASGQLAQKSRGLASDLRSSLSGEPGADDERSSAPTSRSETGFGSSASTDAPAWDAAPDSAGAELASSPTTPDEGPSGPATPGI
ncbi:MAG: hypothetical protein H0U58_09950 [Chloroflexi bacterium]|nr:hypothetical protein [Chloroflexota bacterium]